MKTSIPASSKRIKTRPFAYGEVTGHSHRVAVEDEPFVEMYQGSDGQIYVRALKEVRVLHEDHDPTGATSVLPVGWEGEIVIAKEYEEEQDFRRVVD
ncbi:MAG TPA: hypothetical protein VH744_11905 [Terriglobales bacterium]